MVQVLVAVDDSNVAEDVCQEDRTEFSGGPHGVVWELADAY